MIGRAVGKVGDADASPDVTLLEAIRSTLMAEMLKDDRIVLLGQDIGVLGGVFRVTRGLQETFPARVIDTPLAEGAIIGAALGMAIGGLIPVPELQFLGFSRQAFHQIGGQLGRLRFRSKGRYHANVTIRAPFGGGFAMPEFHSDALEALFVHEQGIKIACPAFPDDAKGLLSTSIADPDPVLFLEPQRLYRSCKGTISEDDYRIPFGKASVRRSGADITLVAWGAAVHDCLGVASELSIEGIEVEVLDLRTLVPLDLDSLLKSAYRTRRVVVVHEGPVTGGFGGEIAALVQEHLFSSLEAPVLRVAGQDIPYPHGGAERHFMPSQSRIMTTVRRSLDAPSGRVEL